MTRLGAGVALILAAGCGGGESAIGDLPSDGGASIASGGSANGGVGANGGDGGASPAGGGTAPSSGGAASGSDGCNAFAQAYCAQQLACFPSAFRGFWFKTLDDCIADQSHTCAFEIAAPGTSATGSTQAACAVATSKQTCGEFLTAAAPECLTAGSLPDGAGCEFSSQCQSAFCDSRDAMCGKCAPRVGEGGPCFLRADMRFSTCTPGLICSGNTCVKPVPLGGACDRTRDDCAPSYGCFNGQCENLVPLGGTCNDRGQCSGDAFCQTQSAGVGVCTAFVYVPLGAACTESGPNVCWAGSNCRAADGTFSNSGTCVVASSAGTPCKFRDDCLGFCTNGVCQDRAAASTCQ
jgi:hypothetical protein